jgi:hypothetical protein
MERDYCLIRRFGGEDMKPDFMQFASMLKVLVFLWLPNDVHMSSVDV